MPDWDEHTRLSAEKEILGFFISGHPLEKYKDKLQDLRALSIEEIAGMTKSTGKDETIVTAGIIGNVRVQKSKKGDFYAQSTLEDMSGLDRHDCLPRGIQTYWREGEAGSPGTGQRRACALKKGANPKITAAEIMPLEEAKVPLPRALRIRVMVDTAGENTIDDLHTLFTERKGEAKVLFDIERQGDFMVVMEADGYNVLPDRNFIARVEQLCGRGSVRIIS